MRGLVPNTALTGGVPGSKITQREDKFVYKSELPFMEEKTLQGESHERWGMK
jgi:hypothetical protein